MVGIDSRSAKVIYLLPSVKVRLEGLKVHRRECFNDVVDRLLRDRGV